MRYLLQICFEFKSSAAHKDGKPSEQGNVRILMYYVYSAISTFVYILNFGIFYSKNNNNTKFLDMSKVMDGKPCKLRFC